MKILMIDADSQDGFPNLALMKLASYYRHHEDAIIHLIRGIPESPPLDSYDMAFISCIYNQNRTAVINYGQMLLCPVEYGGSGFDLSVTLPEDIEHMMPYYKLYNTEFSMGFTSRGCIRKCGFCIVPEKEGNIKDWAPITEFLHPSHRKIILLDNNFLASPEWESNLEFIAEQKLQVNFSQGLDIRLVTEENAKLLHESKYSTWKFNTRRISFAYDSIKYKSQVERGINTLIDNGISKGSIMIYILVGYDSTIYEDLDRIEHLNELGIDAYIMRYNQNEGPHRILMHLARWVNKRINRNVSFMDYDYSDSQEAIKKAFASGPHSSNKELDEQTELINGIQKELGDYEEEDVLRESE